MRKSIAWIWGFAPFLVFAYMLKNSLLVVQIRSATGIPPVQAVVIGSMLDFLGDVLVCVIVIFVVSKAVRDWTDSGDGR